MTTHQKSLLLAIEMYQFCPYIDIDENYNNCIFIIPDIDIE